MKIKLVKKFQNIDSKKLLIAKIERSNRGIKLIILINNEI